MNNHTYFRIIIPLLYFYTLTIWNDLIWSRFMFIFISIVFLFLSGITMSIEKDKNKLEQKLDALVSGEVTE